MDGALGISALKPGDGAEISRYFGREEVAAFAMLIGDYNPIHLDEAFAANTQFGRCIVHGPLYSSLIGTILGTQCPGPGTILVSQDYRFRKPVYVGDTITAGVRVMEIDRIKGAIWVDAECRNQAGIIVLSGHALTRIAR
jgi:acyl dehydratase